MELKIVVIIITVIVIAYIAKLKEQYNSNSCNLEGKAEIKDNNIKIKKKR